jgi:hypothetical protein
MFEQGQCAMPQPVRELPNFLVVDMDPVREPDVICEPVDGFHPIHRC